jgi:peptidoglycan/LPS O-acetylase OafA/YrhL
MEQSHRAAGLDTLRGAAILAVLTHHFIHGTGVIRTPALHWLEQFTSHCFLGVDLFFVLSGFLIGTSLMASRGDETYFSAYFARRIGRIFPLYYCWLAIFILMTFTGVERLENGLPLLLRTEGVPWESYLTFTQNFFAAREGNWGAAWMAVTWSLAVEMHFYLLAAVAIYLVPVRYVGVLAVAVIAAAAWLRINGGYSGFAQLVLTQVRIDMPFAGVLAAWLLFDDRIRSFVARHAATLRIVAVSLIVLFNLNYVYFEIPTRIPFSVTLIAFTLAVIAFSQPWGTGANIAVRCVRWCGVRCYGIYIFHVGILGLVSSAMYGWPHNSLPLYAAWRVVIVALIVTFALAAASWKYFEKPILVWTAGRFPQRRALATLERQFDLKG